MGYWMHVYDCDEPMSFESVEEYFADDDVTAELCGGDRGAWRQFSLERDGGTVALVELLSGDVLRQHLAERIEDVLVARPRCNAEYVAALLRRVRSVYQFQVLGGDVDDAVRDLQEMLTYGSDAVLWAEGEGFSCDCGHLTWEFSEGVSGPWSVTLYQDGRWENFRIELGDKSHRDAFLDGRRPEGA